MRAWELTEATGPRALVLAERRDPEPGPAEAVLQVEAISLNYRDLLMVRGHYSKRMPARMVPCSDAAGTVIAVGRDVGGLGVGDRATSSFAPAWLAGQFSLSAARSALGAGHTQGCLADRLVLPAHALMPVPPHLSAHEAATLPCAALTAWHALFEEASIRPGDAVLTLGSGGVSVFALQFARAAGARVIATTSSDEKAKRLRTLGAGHVINYREEPSWGDAARAAAGGEGVDHVVEVGGQGTFDQSVRAVRLGGTVSLIGVLAGPAPVNLTPVLMRNIRVQGVMVGSLEMHRRMVAAISHLGLGPIVDRVFSFASAPEAFEYLASGAHLGKVVIGVEG
jgi:NADPH:quinone reductase-like Zn-dependent oxidoreductase